MRTLFFLFVAGGMGCSFRYLATAGVTGVLGGSSHWATLAVNALGCLCIGLLNHLTQQNGLMGRDVSLVLTTGFLGGLTTFSAFGYESYILLERRAFFWAAANMLGSLLLGLVCVWVGIWLGRNLAPG